jgi:hypothetical protein
MNSSRLDEAIILWIYWEDLSVVGLMALGQDRGWSSWDTPIYIEEWELSRNSILSKTYEFPKPSVSETGCARQPRVNWYQIFWLDLLDRTTEAGVNMACWPWPIYIPPWSRCTKPSFSPRGWILFQGLNPVKYTGPYIRNQGSPRVLNRVCAKRALIE